MATNNCLVTNILQNIFFCVQQKKELVQVWNKCRVNKWSQTFLSLFNSAIYDLMILNKGKVSKCFTVIWKLRNILFL